MQFVGFTHNVGKTFATENKLQSPSCGSIEEAPSWLKN